MRILQLVLPGASEYERKSQRVDQAMLSAAGHEVLTDGASARAALIDVAHIDVAHVYGPRPLQPAAFRKFAIPYVANAEVRYGRLSFRKVREPEYVVGPVEDERHTLLPEAVEEAYFAAGPSKEAGVPRQIGSFGSSRPNVRNMIEQTLHRLHRFREDIEWSLLDSVPTPEDLALVDVWVDPASSADDYDGFTAEALAAGKLVVATRTPLNAQRLEKGRTGWLVPIGDPNELTHAILAALFKPEIGDSKASAARQTISKFRSRQRLRVLAHMYETLTR